MTDHCYIAVKGSLHSLDCSVFGLTYEEIVALSKRFYDSCKEVINGVLIKGSPIHVINALSEIGYRVICSSGETEIVWTLRREVLVSKRAHSQDESCRQSMSNKMASLGPSILPQKTVTETVRKSSLSPVGKGINEENIRNQSLTPAKTERIKPDRLGSKPEDKAQYGPKGSTIDVKDIESIEENPPPEEKKIILNTNKSSEFNPLSFRNLEPQSAKNYLTTYSETIAKPAVMTATGTVNKGNVQCKTICPPDPRIQLCEAPGGKPEFVLAEYGPESSIAKAGGLRQQTAPGKTINACPMKVQNQVAACPQNVDRNQRIRTSSPVNQNMQRRKTVERIGTKPEDMAQYGTNKRKIEVIDIENFEDMPEDDILEKRIILKTNESSEENPLSNRNLEPQENLMSRFAHSSKRRET